jgi:TM2 domain-containing membrane protein YozV
MPNALLPPRTSDPAVIEHRLLDLAYTTDSIITAPVLAYYVPCSIGDAERVLERLVTEDRLRMEVDDEGNIHYVMPNRQRLAPQRVSFPGALARQSPQVIESRHTPNAAAAAVLSLIVPGAGQLYAGRPLSAIAWFMVVSMGYLLLVVPGVLLHILCIAAAAGAAHQWRPSMA